MRSGMRFGSVFFALLFTMAAIVQWNDPDPLAWVSAYATGALLSWASATGRRLPRVTTAAAIVFGLAFASIAISLVGAPAAAFTSFEMSAPDHEAPREAAGLGLLCAWTSLLAWRARRAGPGGEGEAQPAP